MNILWILLNLCTFISAYDIHPQLMHSLSLVKFKSASILKQSLSPAAIQDFYQIWNQITFKIADKCQIFYDRLPSQALDNEEMRKNLLLQIQPILKKWLDASMMPFLSNYHIPDELLLKWIEFFKNFDPQSSFKRQHKRMLELPRNTHAREIELFSHEKTHIHLPETSNSKNLEDDAAQISIHVAELENPDSTPFQVQANVMLSFDDPHRNRILLKKKLILPVVHPDGSTAIMLKQPQYDDASKMLDAPARPFIFKAIAGIFVFSTILSVVTFLVKKFA